MNLNDLTGVVAALKEALLEEWNAITVVASWEGTVQAHRADAVAKAYEEGVINGKNADTRKAQEAKVLEDDQAYQMALASQVSNRNNMKQLEINRKCVETRISLLRAWLYSQAEAK